VATNSVPLGGQIFLGIVMDDNLFLIIMALVAGFIILQLRRSLGRKGGYDGKGEHGSDSKPQKKDAPQDNIVSIKNSLNQDDRPTKAPHQKNDVGVPKSSPFYATLEKINSFDKDFTLSSFIDGAEYAYGFILSAFWEGNCKTLGNHLSRDVLGEFEGVINDMKGAGQTFDNVLNDIEKIELNDASINGTMAEITIKFNSHMTVVIKNKDGSVAHGDPEKVLSVVDIWTFCRDVARGDPNWTLVATSNE
jgi:predicted lipid-binding transport protein (Tim44 family)|tara:strand:- start:32689 stop:33435 length:747 start_codon:yes stop_codon:yes gene_type:complete